MKNILLVITLLVIVGFGINSVEAASGSIGWSQKLKCETSCPRFVVLKAWDDLAVLDKETGLVWEQSPDTTTRTWITAQFYCNSLIVSNRGGWRLPTFQELRSLMDSSQNNPSLPSAHPFSNVINDYYWSATIRAETTQVWATSFSDGFVSSAAVKTNPIYTWCVRGGSGVDAQ